MSRFAEPLAADYLHPFDVGTNIIGLIPGGELSDQYVIIGAHYDHLGVGARDTLGAIDDNICNGATDNATSVAEVIEIGRSIAAAGTPRRSVVIALWDAEEDGLIGSRRYVDDPVVPLEQTVAYLNFDNQGLDLTPGLANWTIAIGAETGGTPLMEAAARAFEASTLTTVSFSLLFGQGRSDHAVLAGAGVPVVFFTDATDGCYHTVRDDLSNVDFAKLDQQIASGLELTRTLVETDMPPVFVADAPAVTFSDAAQLLLVVEAALADVPLLSEPAGAQVTLVAQGLRDVVESGPAAFGDAERGIVLSGAAELVQVLDDSECGLG